MHVFWLRWTKACHNARSNSLINHLSTPLPDSLGLTWLSHRRHASWYRRHSANSLPIAQIRWSFDSYHPSTVIFHRCYQRNLDVSRFAGQNRGYCWEHGLLQVWNLWDSWLYLWERIHQADYGSVRHLGMTCIDVEHHQDTLDGLNFKIFRYGYPSGPGPSSSTRTLPNLYNPLQ